MNAKPVWVYSIVTVGLFLCGLTSPASAKDDAETAQEKAAKKACAMGDYEKGAEILTDLFVATDDVTYIYNQARCYEQNNRWERAIARFREFLRKAKHLSKSERAETEQHIAECEAALRQAPPPATPAPPPALPPAPAPAPVPEPPADVQPQATAPEGDTSSPPPAPPVGSPGRGLRIAGVILGGVGVAAIGAGVGCTLKTQSISSNERKTGATKAQEDERKKYETWGWVGYGVGAAALATGVVLYLVGWPSAESAGVALLPSVSSTGGSLLLAGRF
jgi:hypothetical protein